MEVIVANMSPRRFDKAITGWGTDHPQFSITVRTFGACKGVGTTRILTRSLEV